ncbi:MAG: methyltransferase domain-containing protein [Pyrinomonadaceae bacterium]
MKEKLLELLACPSCGGDILLVHVGVREQKEIIEGVLSCKKCEREYKVVRGVPRFAALDKIEQDKADTAENFGWQWTHFTQDDPKYAEQLLGWLQPVKKDFFNGKIVLEGGCGKGRHTTLAADWGAKEVVGIDLSAAVETAFQATKNLPNAHILQADIFKLPLKKPLTMRLASACFITRPPQKKRFFRWLQKLKKRARFSLDLWRGEQRMDY